MKDDDDYTKQMRRMIFQFIINIYVWMKLIYI